eukprot:PITA_09495
MDFITGLPVAKGRDCIYVVVDRLTKFAHFFAIPSRSSNSQELFRLVGTELTPSTSYRPQTNEKIEIVNKWMEGYLRNYVPGQQRAWVKWLHLGEFCYNTTYHMSIGMTPFRALYGYDALSFSDMIFGDSRAPGAKDWIQESQEILKALKDNLQVAQNQQNMYADRRMVERHFEVGDMVYLRLQPYKQSSLK